MKYAQRAQPPGRRAGGWYLYRFTTDLRCARNCPPGAHPLYQGKSNDPRRRLVEHSDQPWWPRVTGWSIDPGVYGSDAEVLAAERDAIHRDLPLANIEHNEGNDHRLWFGPYEPVRSTGTSRRKRSSVVQVGGQPARWVSGAWLALAVVLWWASGSLVLAAVVTGGLATAAHIRLK